MTTDGGGGGGGVWWYCAQGRKQEDQLGMRNDCGLGGDAKGETECLDCGKTKKKTNRIC